MEGGQRYYARKDEMRISRTYRRGENHVRKDTVHKTQKKGLKYGSYHPWKRVRKNKQERMEKR